MNSNYVLLKHLAQELGMDRSHARRYVLKNDIPMFKVRTKESRGQLTLALTPEDAESVKELRQSQGFAIGGRPGKAIVNNGHGWFYIIQLVPELDEGRIKLGFAGDIETRLQSHRTVAPTAEVVKAWYSKQSWEQAAIDCVVGDKATDCWSIGGEVYGCRDLGLLIQRGDAFFSIMPRISGWQAPKIK